MDLALHPSSPHSTSRDLSPCAVSGSSYALPLSSSSQAMKIPGLVGPWEGSL